MTATAYASCRFGESRSGGVATFWVDAYRHVLQRMLWFKLYLAGWFITLFGVCSIILQRTKKWGLWITFVLGMLVHLLYQAAFSYVACTSELAQHHQEYSTFPVYLTASGACVSSMRG